MLFCVLGCVEALKNAVLCVGVCGSIEECCFVLCVGVCGSIEECCFVLCVGVCGSIEECCFVCCGVWKH